MGWTVTTLPSEEPVTLAQAKLHLRVTDSLRDTEITRKITAARQYIESECQIALLAQEWRVTYDGFPSCGALLLPGGKVREVVSVESMDSEGAFSTVSSDDYDQDLTVRPARLLAISSWPSTPSGRLNTVRVQLRVGYENVAAVPGPLVESVLLVIGDLFENRQAQQAEPLVSNPALDVLTRPYRRFIP